MKRLLSLLVLTLWVLPTMAYAGFPENDLDQEDCLFCFEVRESFDAKSQEKFEEIIELVSSEYSAAVEAFGGNLVFEKSWSDSTVNASTRREGNDWIVSMYGGLYRRAETTNDGFALVVCHEIGHQIAFWPFYSGDWAATEGQSDYWATQVCAKRIFGSDYLARGKGASQSLANLLAALGKAPSPSPFKKDKNKVLKTYESHPNSQCRLDTYLAGLACNAAFPSNVSPKNQAEAFKYSCQNRSASRPLCWFAPSK